MKQKQNLMKYAVTLCDNDTFQYFPVNKHGENHKLISNTWKNSI